MKPRQPRHQPRQKPRHNLLMPKENHANHAKNPRVYARASHTRTSPAHTHLARVYTGVVGVVGVVYEYYQQVTKPVGVVSGVVFPSVGVVFDKRQAAQ